MSLKVGIAGLGRIGRGVLRANFAPANAKRFEINVICDVMPIEHVAYLLAHDSTYGRPPFSIVCEADHLVMDGCRIAYLRVDRRRARPEDEDFADLKSFGIDVLFDATGTATINDFRAILDHKAADKILCTWNVSGCDLSVVYGVNHTDYNPALHHVVSASTCTGNALVPVFHIVDKHIGIDFARIITIHPKLSDQRVLDGYHASSQLGRSCAESIVPTPTNVGKSAILVLPGLTGKLDSLSYRVPTAIVSVIDCTVHLSRDASHEEIVGLLSEYSQNQLAGVIYCEYGAWGHQKASIDYLGTEYSAIILMEHLSLNHSRQLGLALMHDNEYAYCRRVLDVLGVMQTAKS